MQQVILKDLQPLPTIAFVLEIPVLLDEIDTSIMLFPRQGVIVACGECCDGFKPGDKVRLPLFHHQEALIEVEEGKELIKIDCEFIHHIEE